MPSPQQKIDELITQNDVFVFMKGEKDQPMCGFSASVVDILNEHGVDYDTFNVLMDPQMREAIKDYTNWPTIPQIFVKGKFIGGADILQELHESGELKNMF